MKVVRVSHVVIWGGECSGQREHLVPELKTGAHLVCSGKSREAGVAGAD